MRAAILPAVLAVLLAPSRADAQLGGAPVNRADAAVGTDANLLLVSLGLNRHWSVAREGRVRLGAGVRWSSFIGGEYRLSSAERPAIAAGRLDSLFLDSPWLNAINLTTHVTVQPAERWALGMNIDVAGFSWGTSEIGRFKRFGGTLIVNETSVPTSGNLLLGGTRDRGTLASEFYIAYDLRRDVRLRTGLNHFVVEYATETPGTDGGTRYRRFGNAWFVGISRLLR